jgi:hypothetical protein
MTTSRKHFIRSAAMTLAPIVLVASCGSPGKTKTATTVTTAKGASPSEAAFGLDRKSLLARQLKVEALVATCMKKQGFDYVPMDPSSVAVGQGKFVVTGLNEDEFRKQYGYGITTTYDVKGPNGTVGTLSPNAKIRDALSATDRKSYDKALHGGSTDGTFADAVVQGDFGKLGGCNKSAAAEVFGGSDALNVVQSVIEEVDKRVTADPQMIKAEKAWTDCLQAAGFKYSTSDQVDEALRSRLKAIVGTTPGNTNYDKVALAAVQQEELRTAEADWACEVKHKLPVEPKVVAAIEKAYFDAHPGLAAKVKG